MVANLHFITVSQLYYHSSSLLSYMGLKHDGEVNSKIVDGVEVREIDRELTTFRQVALRSHATSWALLLLLLFLFLNEIKVVIF